MFMRLNFIRLSLYLSVFLLFVKPNLSLANLVQVTRPGQAPVDYASIQAAVNISKPGDTISVHEGVYYEKVVIENKAGTADQPITIRGSDSTQCIIDGSATTFVNPQAGTWQKDTLAGLSCYSSSYELNASSPSAHLGDGSRLWTFGSATEFGKSNILSGIYYDSSNKKVYVKLEGGTDPNTVSLFIGEKDYTLKISNSNHIIIENLKVINGGTCSVRVSQSNNVVLSNLTVVPGKNGIYLKDTSHPVTSSDIRIVGCTISDTYDSSWYWSDFKDETIGLMEGAGIYIVNSGISSEISNCEISGVFDGIATAVTNSTQQPDGLVVKNNTIYSTMDDAVALDSEVANTQMFGNTIYDTFVGISLAPAQGPLYIYRNIVLADKRINYSRSKGNTMRGPVFKIGGKTDKPSSKVRIYNNTLSGQSHVICARYQDRNSEDFKYYNNIFYSNSGSPIYGSGLPENKIFFDGNLHYKASPAYLLREWQAFSSDRAFYTLKDAVASQGSVVQRWESNGLERDPKITGAFTHPPDASLSPDSPAIDSGLDVRAFGWPDAVSVDDGRYDIGAIEAGSATEELQPPQNLRITG